MITRYRSTDIQHSVASLEAKANVCCVKFNPSSCYHLAFGSADHCVHYYDLRYTKQPLNVFKGHKKAVSYVKFLNKVRPGWGKLIKKNSLNSIFFVRVPFILYGSNQNLKFEGKKIRNYEKVDF